MRYLTFLIKQILDAQSDTFAMISNSNIRLFKHLLKGCFREKGTIKG
jgi:hypothetical protein